MLNKLFLNINVMGCLDINKSAEPFISFWITIWGLLISKFNTVFGFKCLISSSSSSSSSSTYSNSSSLLISNIFSLEVLENSLLCSLIWIEFDSIFLLFFFVNFLSVSSPLASLSLSLSLFESFNKILSNIKNKSLKIISVKTSLLNLFQAILKLVKLNLKFISPDNGFLLFITSNSDILINMCLKSKVKSMYSLSISSLSVSDWTNENLLFSLYPFLNIYSSKWWLSNLDLFSLFKSKKVLKLSIFFKLNFRFLSSLSFLKKGSSLKLSTSKNDTVKNWSFDLNSFSISFSLLLL